MSKPHKLHLECPKFYTYSGRLTQYAFACGYIMHEYVGETKVTFYKDCLYHVVGYDQRRKKRLFWHSVPSVTAAEKLFKEELRKLRSSR